MTFTFWLTITIATLAVLFLIAAMIIAVKLETQRIIRGRRAGKPATRITEARRILARADALKFPTHRKPIR